MFAIYCHRGDQKESTIVLLTDGAITEQANCKPENGHRFYSPRLFKTDAEAAAWIKTKGLPSHYRVAPYSGPEDITIL